MTETMGFWYRVPYECEESTYFVNEKYYEQSAGSVAAQDFWDNHDGWESSWPVTFEISKTEDFEPILRCTVEMEMHPWFRSNDEILK